MKSILLLALFVGLASAASLGAEDPYKWMEEVCSKEALEQTEREIKDGKEKCAQGAAEAKEIFAGDEEKLAEMEANYKNCQRALEQAERAEKDMAEQCAQANFEKENEKLLEEDAQKRAKEGRDGANKG